MPDVDLAVIRERLGATRPTPADIAACAASLASLAALEGTKARRVAVAGDSSLQLLSLAISCAIAQEGELALMHTVPCGEGVQQCLDRHSALHAFRPDTVVLVPDWREAAPPMAPTATASQASDTVQAQVRHYQQLWAELEASGCRIVQHLVVPPARYAGGLAERRHPASITRRVDALNAALLDAGAGRVTWLEADRLATQVGLTAWSSARFWHAGRIAFDPSFLPDYLPWFRAAWRTAHGRVKKVLVVDLDDTLWGGTIGDDGLDGIALGPGHGGRGEAFAVWQQHLAQLSGRGVVLAACSKNDATVAASAFTHPSAALRREDFAAFVCNWDDKARNLERIAAELNLGLDTFVFVDDNPAERALVAQALPQVSLVDPGADPASFIDRLEAGRWFDMQAYTTEDMGRATAYAARSRSRQAAAEAVDMSAYLESLEMTGRAAIAQPADLPRLAQLELKTNQFNLTTRRFSQQQLAAFLDDPQRVVLALHLADRFGDHGLVSSLVAAREGSKLRIDSWLLSCRVFGREAEPFMLAELARIGKDLGATMIEGEYLPSARNAVVAGLYRRLGFEPATADGRFWQRDLTRPLDDLRSSISDRVR